MMIFSLNQTGARSLMSRHAHSHAHANNHGRKTHKHQLKQQPTHVAVFVGQHKGEARAIAALSGVPAEVVLAQSALESDWGRTVKGNAYFGIKGKSAAGNSTTFSTHEVTLSGQRVSEVDEFRAYNSYAEAAEDYVSLIQRRYSAAFAFRNDPEKFAQSVARQGYATDPRYAEKLKSIIHLHITPLLGK
jgi:flagellum-specific peptidoglycan hydrolase FlgJ